MLRAKKVPSRRTILGLNELEPRLVPAGVNDFDFTNVDGSLVKVHLSRPLLTNANESSIFTLDNQGLGQQLEEINLTSLGAAAKKLNLTVTAVPGPLGGDGFVNVGFIDATGINLGAVTIHGDLGAIDAGSQSKSATALTALTVQSMGEFGTSTQAGIGTLESDISGTLEDLTVESDLDGAFINVTGSIGTVSVGGSLVGAAADYSGSIQSTDTIGTVTIGGDILGGTGFFTGSVFAQTSVKRVTVGGNVVGSGVNSGQVFSNGTIGAVTVDGNMVGASDYSGQIFANDNIGPVTIGGDLVGGGGQDSGQIFSFASLSTVNVGGNVVGGMGIYSGLINSNGTTRTVTVGGNVVGGAGEISGEIYSIDLLSAASIGGSIIGGSGEFSGRIMGDTNLGQVTLGGSLLGGSTQQDSGQILANDDMGFVTIKGNVVGGSAAYTGQVTSLFGSIAGVRVDGSVIGGSGQNSGQIETANYDDGGSIGPVAIAGSLVGGSGFYSGEILANVSLASVSVGGSIIAGTNNGAMTQSICAGASIGAITVGGSLVGTSDSPVFITAVGQANLARGARSDVAIASLSVAGKVEYADILAGYNLNLIGVNGQASIGPVTVGLDWIASNLIAGVSGNFDTTWVTTGTTFGGIDSVDLPPAFPSANLIATIANVSIGGAILGTPASVNNLDQFGFVAQEIATFSVGGVALNLNAGPSNDNLPVGDTGDVNILEV